MSLINPAILWGLGLVSIPIILHFLLRSKPKKYLFPALRLVRVRRQNNIRRLRLKQFWLLLLRMGVLALIVAAIARPTLPAANYRPSATEWLTAAAIAGVAMGVYTWFVRSWRQKRLPNHVFMYRRTMLRGGTGLLVFALLALAVALPYGHRIKAEISSPLPSVAQNLPVAAVFLFDTSLSMSYRQRNFTRLEAAQQIAAEHLGRLPTGSRVAIADTSTEQPLVFQAEQSGALDRIQKLQPRPVSLPLPNRIRASLALQDEDFHRTMSGQESVPAERRADRFLREIYLFTDLTVAGWRSGDFEGVKEQLTKLTNVQLYIIDVGVEKVTNAAVLVPQLSSQSIPKGSDLVVDAKIDAVGFEADREWNLELHVQNEKGQLVKREQRTLKATAGKPAFTSFVIGGLARPITQGELRLVSSDPYPVDDVRYFTVAIVAPVSVLVVGERREETNVVEQALAPSEFAKLGKARYKVTYRSAKSLSEVDLKSFDLVCLDNVAAPTPTVWSSLGDFVEAGGGLLVIAGNDRLSPESYNIDAAQAVLPGRLTGNVKLPDAATLDLHDFVHPIFKKFEFADGGFGELATEKIYHRWGVQPAKGAAVIAKYTDPAASPAIVERQHGAGRTLLITTGLDGNRSGSRKGWSNLAFSGWRFLALLDQVAHYLSRQSETSYNCIAGDDVSIPLPQNSPLRGFFLRKPQGEQLPGDVSPPFRSIGLHNIDQIGNYEIVSRDEAAPFSSAFSANASPAESDFTHVGTDELDRILGPGRYSVSRSIEGLTRNVAFGRVGQEVFSLILGVVIAVFCAEHFVANRFYESEQTPEHQ
jgi:Aerotolerance regulator N-terminal